MSPKGIIDMDFRILNRRFASRGDKSKQPEENQNPKP